MAAQTTAFDPNRTLLLVVDMQPDFMPGGALPVAGGDLLVRPIRNLMESGKFLHFAGTQDWHPAGHISFASSHPGHQPLDTIELYGHDQILWPDHCVQGTPGADLHTGIPTEKFSVIVRKATDPRVDSYSAFRNNWGPDGERPPTGLSGYLRERGIDDVFLCGLARDFCVKWSAEDGVEAGFNVWVIWDLTRSVDASGDQAVREGLTGRGIRIIASDMIAG
jgi:nicotinamidase/pyrazinamidase